MTLVSNHLVTLSLRNWEACLFVLFTKYVKTNRLRVAWRECWIKLSNDSNFGLSFRPQKKNDHLEEDQKDRRASKETLQDWSIPPAIPIDWVFHKSLFCFSEPLQGKNSFCSKLTTTYHTYLHDFVQEVNTTCTYMPIHNKHHMI